MLSLWLRSSTPCRNSTKPNNRRVLGGFDPEGGGPSLQSCHSTLVRRWQQPHKWSMMSHKTDASGRSSDSIVHRRRDWGRGGGPGGKRERNKCTSTRVTCEKVGEAHTPDPPISINSTLQAPHFFKLAISSHFLPLLLLHLLSFCNSSLKSLSLPLSW